MTWKFTKILFLMSCLHSTAFAQHSTPNGISSLYDYVLEVEKSSLKVVNDRVMASVSIIAKQDVPARQSVILVPELQDTIGGNVASFPPIFINSRNQQIFFERELSRHYPDALALRKHNGKDLDIDYMRSVPYQKWMETSVLVVRKLSCACNVPTKRGEEHLCALHTAESKANLLPAYRVPVAEREKVREVKGSANLQFHVDKWDILPDYRNNNAELKKIYSSIDIVKNDPNVKIKKMTIEGYASPEGGLQHNQMLSENRTNALRDFLDNRALLPHITITAQGKGENWTGFKQYLARHNDVPQRQQLLAIIAENIGQDEKEAKMRQTAREGFLYCVNNVFPSLRCTNYAVEYTVRPFTLEESEAIFETRPVNLSLNEIYRLADKYRNDSIRYNTIMRKASVLYPDDPYVNLTMSYLAIRRGDTEEAKQYLDKVPDSWKEKHLNQSIVAYLKGELSAGEIKRIQSEFYNKK